MAQPLRGLRSAVFLIPVLAVPEQTTEVLAWKRQSEATEKLD